MITSLPDYWFNKSANTQRRYVATDAGSVVATYSNYLTGVQIRVVPASGGESGGQGRLTTNNPVTIYGNGAPDIVATDRIVFDSEVYDITSVNNPDEQDAYLIMTGYKVMPAGVGS